MKTFLEYVAHDVLTKYGHDLSNIAIVFPNKRASLFFNEQLARLAGQPVWSPAYITISDLFRTHSKLQVADQIKLICDLHKCFVKVTGMDETLDHFYGWGQLLLADFDDIDKNMADAADVFTNLSNIHELDDVSYLSHEQKEIIRKFFGNFSDDHNTELKQKFMNLWSHFHDIYTTYNSFLSQQGLAYEGALYRQVVSDESLTFEHETYLFVGFNLLQKVDINLFHRLKQEGKAFFYWDFDQYYMHGNEAGHYISQYLELFPNELDKAKEDIYNNFRQPKQMTYISATTESIQTHYMAQWLKENNRKADGKRTAVVLCDEALLPVAMHCLPDEVEKVNITTGFPLNQSPVASLLMQLFSLQTAGYVRKTQLFRLHYINKVLRHPLAEYISSQRQDLCKQLNTSHTYYASHGQLALDEGLQLLFTNFDEISPKQMCEWLTELIRIMASNCNNDPTTKDDPLMTESLFRTYTLVNRLLGLMESGDLNIDLNTLHRLLTQLVRTTSIPFHGEPAEGLQMMGVLETRNLDFDHVLLLSCNEGNMPKGVNDTSFIPYSIRKAFGLTTIDHKVAIYSYYFHRLLQRCQDVTIVYNNATEDGKTGEMSRFMLQMLVESGQDIRQLTLKSRHKVEQLECQQVVKTPEMMEQLYRRFDVTRVKPELRQGPLLSPSAINRYMKCPLSFYYYYVECIREYEDEEDDTIDGRIFGNIFHKAAQTLYNQLGYYVTAAPLQALLKNKIEIERAVDNAFKTELFNISPTTKMPDLNGIQIINREVIIRYMRQLLTLDIKLAPFTITGLELPVMMPWTINPEGCRPFVTNIGGTIDRMDCITGSDGMEKIRIVDYKTGGGKMEVLPDVSAIFDDSIVKKHKDYYLQTFLYGTIVGSSEQYNRQALKVSPALFFVQRSNQDDYDPTLCFGSTPIDDVRTFREEFAENIRKVVNDIFNPAVPFNPTDNKDTCSKCPFEAICNR